MGGYRGPSCALVECPSAADPLDDKCSEKTTITDYQLQYDAPFGAAGWEEAYSKNQACEGNNTLWKTVTTTVSTFWIQMAARFMVATVLCLVKTALAVVSVTTPVAHASASADTLALPARRWKKWRNVMMTSVMIIVT